MLRVLHVATRPEQLNLPGFYWHSLRRSPLGDPGDRELTDRLIGMAAMHPSKLLREEILLVLGHPRAEIAHLLGVSRQALYAVLTERASVTPKWR